MESLPFHEMQPRNDLVRTGSAFCLAKLGVAYALYLPQGGRTTIELAGNNRYKCTWWNPANGKDGNFEPSFEASGGPQTFSAPDESDWAMRIVVD